MGSNAAIRNWPRAGAGRTRDSGCPHVVGSGEPRRGQEDAWLGSIDIAIKKAKTAALFTMPSAAIGELSPPGGDLYNVEVTDGGLVTFGGGLPLTSANGRVIGPVGTSGGQVSEEAEGRRGCPRQHAESLPLGPARCGSVARHPLRGNRGDSPRNALMNGRQFRCDLGHHSAAPFRVFDDAFRAGRREHSRHCSPGEGVGPRTAGRGGSRRC
ncbi:heme-binding protein [Streptomyces sp. NPDC096311]|uniref:GlcG/HbpS family heme-binding protein n=1 Tax=Streptomyces sp. NPDC096311 TaxID=3366083 RepID=UPI00380231D4